MKKMPIHDHHVSEGCSAECQAFGWGDASAYLGHRSTGEWFEAGRARGTAQIGALMGQLHASDGAQSPFCVECGHSWPCATLRAVDSA